MQETRSNSRFKKTTDSAILKVKGRPTLWCNVHKKGNVQNGMSKDELRHNYDNSLTCLTSQEGWKRAQHDISITPHCSKKMQRSSITQPYAMYVTLLQAERKLFFHSFFNAREGASDCTPNFYVNRVHSSTDTIESKASMNTSKQKSSYPQKKQLIHSLLQICPLIVATIKANIHSQETGPHVQIER